MDFYLGFFAGVCAAGVLGMVAVCTLMLIQPKERTFQDSIRAPKVPNVPFITKRREVRKPRVNDDRAAFEREQEEG